MKLSVATNFDYKLLDIIKKYPSVKEVFGALSSGVLGGLLPSPFLPTIDKNAVEKYVKKTHELGIEFNYILNSSCSGNIEHTKKGKQYIFSLLKWLSDIKVNTVTIALPYLIDLIRNNFPELKIKISLFNSVNTLQRARFYQKMGVNGITLDLDQNRNFKLLRLLKKELDINISLLANNLCLYGCPYAYYHGTSSSHSSSNIGYYNNYCDFNCRLIKTMNPVEMIKSRWIRPEDIKIYEEIGIDSFKLGGRTKDTQYLIRTIKAYSKRKYGGNLINILNTYEETKINKGHPYLSHILNLNREVSANLPPSLLKLFIIFYQKLPFVPSKNIAKMLARMPKELLKANMDVFFNSSIPFINNQKLEGFIDYFQKFDCNNSNCEECGYCKRYSKKVIQFEEEERKKNIYYLRKVIDLINKINI